MNSTQTVDLHDVDAYWKSRNLVDDRHRPYYLRWLQRFLTGPWGTGRLAPNDALAAFAQHLEQDGRTEEWQVRQAIRSVELFQKHYLRLIYGGGLRVTECTRMRVKDLDFDQGLLFVRGGKGDKDRTTLFPKCLFEPLRAHLERVKTLHDNERAVGGGDVELPYALAAKYPKAAWEWGWQYVFPAKNKSETTACLSPRPPSLPRCSA